MLLVLCQYCGACTVNMIWYNFIVFKGKNAHGAKDKIIEIGIKNGK